MMTNEGARRRGLAKGLSALLGEASGEVGGGVGGGRLVPIELLRPNPLQPRRHFAAEQLAELADSIVAQGILQPLLVRPDPTTAGGYQIVAGERRWRAAQQAHLHEVPVVVRELADAEMLEIALVENLQREDLSALDEAHGYQRLATEFAQTQEDIAHLVGKSRSHVANMLRLLALPAEVKELLETGALSAGHARALLAAPDPAPLAREVVRRGLNVRQTERLSKRGIFGRRAGPAEDPNTSSLAHDLTEQLGLAVEIRHNPRRGGRLTVRNKTLDQLHDLVRRLTGGGGPRLRSL